MSVLQSWLGDLRLERFKAEYLGRKPIARPDRARSATGACDWSVLERLLSARPDDVLVVGRGRIHGTPPPHSVVELLELFERGIGLAIRAPERFSPEIAELASAFGHDVPGVQRVIVFATPKQTHGFGWHYDAEDVFVVQTAGDKSYYFRPNSIDPDPKPGGQPDFRTFRHETTPIMECRLVAGDWLYLPRGYWHVARANQDSLSVSIGVFPA